MTIQRWILAVSFALATGGFLVQFWPLEALGILLAALTGHWIVAIMIGLLLDLANGAPFGMLHFLYIPFTLLAIVASGARRFGLRYFMNSSTQETL